MSQPEPVAMSAGHSEAVGSEGVPQSVEDSAAPVSPSAQNSSSPPSAPATSRFNRFAPEFIPSFGSVSTSVGLSYPPPFVPVIGASAYSPAAPRSQGLSSRGGRGGGGRQFVAMQGYGAGHPSQGASFVPMHGGYLAYHAAPDAHFHVQQLSHHPGHQPGMQHIMLAHQISPYSFNPHAETFTPTSPSLRADVPPVQQQQDLQSEEEEEEPVDPNAPLTWAQRIKLANAKSQPPAPVKAAQSQQANTAVASAPAVTEQQQQPKEEEQQKTEEEAEEEDGGSSTSSFMEAVAGVDCERRIYSVEFLLKFRDYSDPAIPAKELIPTHLYLQPVHEDESLSWRSSTRPHQHQHQHQHQQQSGRGGRGGRAPTKVSGVILEPLKRAEHSWSALQQKLKSSSPEEDEKVERGIRGLLNKLTSDKYEKLKQQLFSETEINIRTYEHISILIRLLFEKATQQHHFIPLYADLCKDCKEWLGTADAQQRVRNNCSSEDSLVLSVDVKEFFRRTLTEQCQQAFDSFLLVPATPSQEVAPAVDTPPSMEDAYAEEVKYRTKVWGNLKLIGQLIARRIISSKVAMKCIDELLAQGDNETLLEALAVFLTDVARLIDNPNWECHPRLEDVFLHLSSLAFARPAKVSSKCRFALHNLLDLRKANWQPTPSGPSPAKVSAKVAVPPAAVAAPTWKPKQSAPPAPKQSAWPGWGKPAATEAAAVPAVSVQSVVKECSGNRDVTAAVRSLKGCDGCELVRVVLDADSKDREMLLEVVRGVVEDLDEGDKIGIIESFINGHYVDMEIDLPNVGSLLRDKLIPVFFPPSSSLPERVRLMLTNKGLL